VRDLEDEEDEEDEEGRSALPAASAFPPTAVTTAPLRQEPSSIVITRPSRGSSVRRPGERKLTIAKMINSDDVSME